MLKFLFAMYIYLFSGLGADARVFVNLDLKEFTPIYIVWKTPLPAETLTQYAQRLIAEQIPKQAQYLLVGVSFGGIVACEVAKLLPDAQVVLISSAKTKYEIPFYYRWAGKLYIDKLLPARLLKQANWLAYWFFGVVGKQERQLLKAILQDTDSKFLKWAIRQVVLWKEQKSPAHCLHLHGAQDKILPFAFVKNAIKIKNGGHFMVLNQAPRINQLIGDFIAT